MSTGPPETKNVGLRGVSVADTMVSDVDGKAGRLIYRGYDIGDLARSSTYEEVAYLLIFDALPSLSELESFCVRLAENRRLTPRQVAHLRALSPDTPTMAVLQGSIALLAADDPRPGEPGKDAERERAVNLVAKTAALVAAWHRIRQGLDPVEPPAAAAPVLGHATDFLRLLNGADPDPALARDLDVALILHADHSMNASTFTARTVASTRAGIYAAISAALGALSGELHGGANARVMEMLQEIGSLERVEAYVRATLAAHGRIMGMGHAVYHTDDPRAVILREMSRRLGERVGDPGWVRMTERVEEVTRTVFREAKQADIYANVDMYSASFYHVMGLPTDLFTPVFAMSRVAGWAAHVIEERFAEAAEKPQLYRPTSDYVGHYCGPDACTYEPPEARS
ncbi:MAG: citrate/2-methylcitrate synthase [Thermoleophilia bacterium]